MTPTATSSTIGVGAGLGVGPGEVADLTSAFADGTGIAVGLAIRLAVMTRLL